MKQSSKGITLIFILTTVFIVILLANLGLILMNNQARFINQRVNRIQASYAAMAALNYSLEALRIGTWTAGKTYRFCNGCSDVDEVNEVNFSYPVQHVDVQITDDGSGIFNLTAVANYSK